MHYGPCLELLDVGRLLASSTEFSGNDFKVSPLPPPLVAVDVAYPHYSAMTCSPTSLKSFRLAYVLGQFPKFFRLISTHLQFKQLWKELFIHNQIISWLWFVLLGCVAPTFCSFSTIRHFFVILTGATTFIIFFVRFNLWWFTWFEKIKLQNGECGSVCWKPLFFYIFYNTMSLTKHRNIDNNSLRPLKLVFSINFVN